MKLIDHIGIVVHDIEKSLPIYTEALGMRLSEIEINEENQVKIAFLPVGDTLVELLQPLAEGTMTADILKEQGECIHHIAFRVEDIDIELAKLKAWGVPLLDETARPGGLGARIAFLHPSAANNISLELVEKRKG